MKKMTKKPNFRNLIRMHCKERNIKLKELAKKIGINAIYMSSLGTKCGITIHMVDEIIKLLKLKGDDAVTLRNAAVYTHPKKAIKIDNKLLAKIEDQVMFDGHDEFSRLEIICATLKFMGVKYGKFKAPA